MRVGSTLLLYSEHHLSILAGTERWTLEVGRRLKRKGWDVTILTTGIGKVPGNLTEIWKTVEETGLHYVELEANPNTIPEVCTLPSPLRSLKDELQGVDVAYWLDGVPRPVSDMVLKLRVFSGVPRVIQGLHVPIFIGAKGSLSYRVHNVFSWLRMLNPLERMNEFHAVNRTDFTILRRWGFKVCYIPNGVDTGFFSPTGRKFERFTVLSVGCSLAKGTDLLMNIIASLAGCSQEVRFLVVQGVYPNAGLQLDLQRMHERNPDQIDLVDVLNRKELREVYARSHLLLAPSRFEGFGNVILEAQSCGLPVLTFDIPGAAQDIVVDGVTGRRATPYRLDEIRRHIMEYVRLWRGDPSEYQAVSTRSRARAREFDWDSVIPVLDRVLRTP